VSAITFATVDEAVAAVVQPVVGPYCRIGGVAVAVTEVSTNHGVDQPIGTCTVRVEAPRPASLAINAEIEIEAGYDGAVRRIFHGRIPNDEAAISDQGRWVRVAGEGWASRLRYKSTEMIEIPGPVSLKDAFRSLCELRSVPTYLADDTTYVDGVTTIMLGGEAQIDGGHVRIDERTSPLDWLVRTSKLFGYRVFDCPDGAVRMARVSGLPPDYEEASTVLSNQYEAGDRGEVRTTLSLREGPAISFAIVTSMAAGTRVTILSGPTVNDSGQTNNYWYEMTTDDGYTGYAGVGGAVLNLYPMIELFPVMRYTEGVNAYSFTNRRDVRPMITYWEVKGATYTAADGGKTLIRSIPAEVPYDEALDPPGFASDTLSNAVLVTDTQAAGARNAHEVDYSEVWTGETWDSFGHPALQPGDVMIVNSPTVGVVTAARWLMSLDQSVTERGYEATMEGWAGAGSALAAGDDCRTETVTIPGDGVVHMGTETLSHYKDPSPDSTEFTIDFEVTHADYSSLRLAGRCHGTNSIRNNTPVTGSKIEIWQLPDPSLPEGPTNELRRAGSVELPTVNEELNKRRNYSSSNQFWQSFTLPLSGNLKEGDAEMRIIAGEYSEPSDGIDDFEIKDLSLTYCGVGQPTLPGGGG
jgi:hypothetical protein